MAGAIHDLHRALQPLQNAANDIQADPTAGNFVDLLGSAESGTEHQVENFGFTQGQTLLHR